MLGQTLAQPIVDPETGEIILMQAYKLGKNNLISLLIAMYSMAKVLLEFYIVNNDGVESKVICNNCNLPFDHRTVTREDMIANILLAQPYGWCRSYR